MAEYRLRSSAAAAIVEHAREAQPRECCGILLGTGSRILESVRVQNLATDPDRFLLDPKQHIDIRRDARRRGLEVIGFYHSHPHSAAQPSATDVAAADTEALHVIVGLLRNPPSIRAFLIAEKKCAEVLVVEIDEGEDGVPRLPAVRGR